MDLREWIIGQHSGISTILKMNLLSAVPEARLPERPGSGANSIAWLLWHIARTEDVAINTVIRGEKQVMQTGDWATELGIEESRIGTGMGDDEVTDFSRRVSVPALLEYGDAVRKHTRAWLETMNISDLDTVPDVSRRLAEAPPALAPQADWVKGLWSGRPASFFVGWVAIGHSYTHLGEMLAVKGQMGFPGL